MEEKRIQRNSSIEILKLIAIVFIVLSHSIPEGDTALYDGAVDINTVTDNIQLIIAGYIKNLGQIGNNIFVVCSAWFLIESNKVRLHKISSMIGDCFFISVFTLLLFTILGYTFPLRFIIKQFFPVSFANSWFLTCYLLLYAIHPLLNIVIKFMSKRALLGFNICFFILYNCMGFVMGNNLFYYSRLIGFVGIYFLVAYIKMYLLRTTTNKKLNIIALTTGVTGWILSSCMTAVLGSHISLFSDQMQRWNNIMNPCFILISVAMFNLFRQREIHIKAVNYLAGLSLLIYVIHTNRIMRDYVRFEVFGYIKNLYGFEHLVAWILLFAVFNLLVGVIFAFLYSKTIQKYVHIVFDKLCQFVMHIYNYIESKIIKLD